MLGCFFAACLVAATIAGPDPLESARKQLIDGAVAIHARTGINPYDYVARIVELQARLRAPGAEDPTVRGDLDRQVKLEAALARTIASPAAFSGDAGPGASDAVVTVNDRPDAVGMYVPSTAQADGSYALVVVLHGRGETESDVISRTLFRDLAERHHAILLAPWAGGDDYWEGDSQREILALVDLVHSRFHIAPDRQYLAGISMGGAGAFHLAASHGDRFTAVLSIIGALNRDDVNGVKRFFRTKNVYLVWGGIDPIMTPAVQTSTYRALARACVAASTYVAPDSEHSLYGTATQTVAAWNDMFAGVAHSQNTHDCINENENGIQ